MLSKALAWLAAVVFLLSVVVRAQGAAHSLRDTEGLLAGRRRLDLFVPCTCGHARRLRYDQDDQFVGVKAAHVVPPALIAMGICWGPCPWFQIRGNGWLTDTESAAQIPVRVLIGVAGIGLWLWCIFCVPPRLLRSCCA